MARLFVLDGPDVGKVVEIEGPSVLGRSPDCEIPLRAKAVSRRHARLEFEGGRWFVVDLGSRNGVCVGGEKVERAQLADGDEIALGDLHLRFRADGPGDAGGDSGGEASAELDLGDEILLDEDSAGPPATLPSAAVTSDHTDRPEGGRAGDGGPPATAPEPAPELTPRERRREELLGEIARGRDPGAFGGDLAQRPLWARALIVVLAIGVMVGSVLGAFLFMRALRGNL